MLKYLLNIRLVNTNLVRVVLIKAEQNNYYNGGISFSFKWNSGSEKAKIMNFSKLSKFLNKLPENSNIITNVIIEDSLLENLTVTKTITQLTSTEVMPKLLESKQIQKILAERMQKDFLNNDSMQYLHYNYMYTINEKKSDTNEMIKVYKNFPFDKPFNVLQQHSTVFQFSKNEVVLAKLQSFLKQFNLENNITNYFLKSQVQANALSEYKKTTLLVDLGLEAITLNNVLYGKIVDYYKSNVGTLDFVNKVKSITNLRRDEINSRFNYLLKFQNTDEDVNLQPFEAALNKFAEWLLSTIKLRIADLTEKNGGKIVSRVAFSGELAWLVQYLAAYFKDELDFELIVLSNSQNSFNLLTLNDTIIEQMLTLLENKNTNEQAQTQTSQVYLQKYSKTSFWSKIKELLIKGV
ncbi:MAG3720 family protein [Mycoplasma buteonis]|uniref:MAG3720 family protein n=1 Tax=Mycoplasma buteonis TaxID=171280 RepID=UPI00055D08CF|nr:hypothetical protein [Mycoplasma buteonis]